MKWIAVAGLVGGAALLAACLWLLRPAHIKAMAERELSRHLNLDVTIDTIAVTLLPRPQVSGTALTFRLPDRPDLPPFIQIDRFEMNVGLLSMVRKHVSTVRADGLHIAVPPARGRQALKQGRDLSGAQSGVMKDVIIDRFITHDAELKFVPGNPKDDALVFAIPQLEVDSIGFDLEMPFTATVINPTPRGTVNATGRIGPWQRDDATALPLSADFTFEDADLSTINGIAGRVDAKGSFSGILTSISVSGSATVRDFSLDLGGHPAQLTSSFDTLVDGTDGTTILKRVDAVLGRTTMHVTGAIENRPGPGRHDVELDVAIKNGRIEDLLSLVLDTPKPVMLGDVTLATKMKLPPGAARVRNRISVTGTFGLEDARFTNAQVQSKLQDLSRRSQGKDEDDAIGRVLSDLHGQVNLSKGVAHLSQLTFQVPGARIALDGGYDLGNGALDFTGTLRMDATVSQAVGGFKSIFIKPFDGLFRKNGAGAVLPIKIGGTRDAPKFGLDVGKVIKRK
jgi:hypothetical protein